MTDLRGTLGRARGLAALLFASISLACASSPRTELSWNVRDRVEYGPRSVKLPPVLHRRTVVTPESRSYAAVTPVPKPRTTPGWYTQTALSQPAPRTTSDIQPERVADAPVHFKWPVVGRVISDFGTSETGERNDGINIAASEGDPIHASASGTVTYCGNELKGYGNLVLIRHDDGYVTAYAHADSILVGRGDRVAAGQVIGTAGQTGDVTRPQLHFEIRRGVQPVDPKVLLPKTLMMASN